MARLSLALVVLALPAVLGMSLVKLNSSQKVGLPMFMYSKLNISDLQSMAEQFRQFFTDFKESVDGYMETFTASQDETPDGENIWEKDGEKLPEIDILEAVVITKKQEPKLDNFEKDRPSNNPDSSIDKEETRENLETNTENPITAIQSDELKMKSTGEIQKGVEPKQPNPQPTENKGNEQVINSEVYKGKVVVKASIPSPPKKEENEKEPEPKEKKLAVEQSKNIQKEPVKQINSEEKNPKNTNEVNSKTDVKNPETKQKSDSDVKPKPEETSQKIGEKQTEPKESEINEPSISKEL